MYYLNSRYYDANTCRFINADSYVSTGSGLLGYNMYAYCNNNPVMYVDPSGEFLKELWDGAKKKGAELWTGLTEIANDLKEDIIEVATKVVEVFVADSDNIDFNSEDKNFKFQDNPNYTLLNSYSYGSHLKNKYYADDDTRTAEGLDLELKIHYVFYLFNNSHAVNGADMGRAEWSSDWNAKLIETYVRYKQIHRDALYDPCILFD